MHPYPEKPQKAYYFGTCLADMLYPQAGMAGIHLIQREGVAVIFPPKQTCCGQPAYNSGFPDEARAVARSQIELFPENYPIVVPSGSCAGMMRHHYPKLFEGDTDIERVLEFSKRIFELSEFLVHVLDIKLQDRGDPIKVTWHSSCHQLREMKTTEESKSLIRQLRNVDLIELQRETDCCGFGGTFAVKQPAISAAMVRDKAGDIRQTGAIRFVTGDCGCLMNISGALKHDNSRTRGQYLAEFIWERINDKPSGA